MLHLQQVALKKRFGQKGGQRKMDRQLFRKKSLDKVSSPEQLNDYIRAAEPGVFLMLAAVIVFLAGVCVWGIFGRLDTVIRTAGVCRNGEVACYVKETDIGSVHVGMPVTVNGETGIVTEIGAVPVEAGDGMDAWMLHLGAIAEGEWVYSVKASAPADDGIYEVQLIEESISPASFVWN